MIRNTLGQNKIQAATSGRLGAMSSQTGQSKGMQRAIAAGPKTATGGADTAVPGPGNQAVPDMKMGTETPGRVGEAQKAALAGSERAKPKNASDTTTEFEEDKGANAGSGALTGAGLGAKAGSMIDPGVGTAVGAAVGAVIGGVAGYLQ